MHCDLDLLPSDPDFNRAHPRLMGSLFMKFHDDRCNGKAIMRSMTLTFDLLTPKSIGQIPNSVGLCVQFNDDTCKGNADMRHNYLSCHFQSSMHSDLDI